MKFNDIPAILYMFAAVIITFIIVNTCISEPQFITPADIINYGKEVQSPKMVMKGTEKNVKENPTSIDANHDWVIAEANFQKTRSGEDLSILDEYINGVTDDNTLKDIRTYSIGLYYAQFDEYDSAFSCLLRVKNHQLKYLNYTLGYCCEKTGQYLHAEEFYKNEIHLHGDIKDAYSRLFNLLLKEGKLAEIKSIFIASTYTFVDKEKLSQYFFLSNNPVGYCITLLKKIYTESNLYGFLGAFFILFCWVFYLRQVDVFKPEKWIYVWLVVAAGSICALLAFPLYDFSTFKLGFNLNGNTGNDFLYSIFGIGLIEELVKIIPLLLLMKFTSLVKEPIDYVIYASFSALGFSFMENILYFDSAHLYIMHSRAMFSTIGHMFNSAIIGYGLASQKLFHRRNKYVNFVYFFGLAAISHGVYDFLLIQYSNGSALALMGFIVYIALMLSTFNNFINNTLNLSSFLKQDDALDLGNLQDILVISLCSVIIYEYIVLSAKFGPTYGNNMLTRTGIQLIWPILNISSLLTTIDLNKGMWDNPILPKYSIRPGLSYLINKKITIYPKPMENVLSSVLPVTGTVLKRIIIGDQSDYLLIKLDAPLNVKYILMHFKIPVPHADLILIKGINRKKTLTLGQKQSIYFVVFSAALDPNTQKLTKQDLHMLEYAYAG